MPAYEGLTLSHEKLPTVLDIGTAYTRFGFAGETSPRCIIPSEYTCLKTKTKRNIFHYASTEELYNSLVDFIHMLYFRHLLVSPKDRKVVIVESIFTPTVFRDSLAKVLFCHFEVSSVTFLPASLVSIYPLAVTTCLTVDIGYEETTIVPIVHGVPLLKAWAAQPLAARQIHDNLKTLLCENNDKSLDLSDKTIEDIKVKTCFVTTMDRSNQYGNNSPPTPPPSVIYPIKGDSFIEVSGKARELAAEVLFPRDNDNLSLGNIILDSILKSPIDARVSLAESILLIGGTSMLPGIKSRLDSELKYLISRPLYKDKCFIKEFKFYTAPAKENYVAWLGGAIYGGTDLINSQSLTREVYYKEQRVPDWSNLIDNSPICITKSSISL